MDLVSNPQALVEILNTLQSGQTGKTVSYMHISHLHAAFHSFSSLILHLCMVLTCIESIKQAENALKIFSKDPHKKMFLKDMTTMRTMTSD